MILAVSGGTAAHVASVQGKSRRAHEPVLLLLEEIIEAGIMLQQNAI
jgi:hypothetical protein